MLHRLRGCKFLDDLQISRISGLKDFGNADLNINEAFILTIELLTLINDT